MLACSLVSFTAFGQPPSRADAAPRTQTQATDANIGKNAEPTRKEPVALLQDLQAQTNSLREELGVLRELPNPEPVPLLLRNEAQLQDYIMGHLDDKLMTHIAHEARILKNLSVIDEDTAYQDLIVDLLTEQVAGYYEPDEQGLYLLADHLDEVDAAVIVHELQHAAQDHYWSLEAILRPAWHQSDTLSARSMLTEGDAMLTMLAYTAGAYFPKLSQQVIRQIADHARKEAEKLAERYPRFVVDELVAPYVEGLTFAYALYRHGGWDAVNSAFENLPVSSAQILYPERYLNGEEPTLLGFELDDADVWGERRHSDIWGMASMRHLFAHLLPDVSTKTIASATAGWRGDRMELWGTETEEYLIWVSVFDSEGAAQEFYSLLRQTLPFLLSKEPTCTNGKHGQHCGVVDGARGLLIEQWGDLSLLVLKNDSRESASGIDASTAQAFERVLLRTAEQVFQTLRRARYPELWR